LGLVRCLACWHDYRVEAIGSDPGRQLASVVSICEWTNSGVGITVGESRL
jgi:hypothetical protein